MTGLFDGNAESRPRGGRQKGSVENDGSNSYGLPPDVVKDLLGRVQSRLSSRAIDVQKTVQDAITNSTDQDLLADHMEQRGNLTRGFDGLPGFPGQANINTLSHQAQPGQPGQPAQTGSLIADALQGEAKVIVVMVIDAIMQLHKEGKLKKCVSSPQTDPQIPKRKSTALNKAVFPQTPRAVADPATTVSVAQASFFTQSPEAGPTTSGGHSGSPTITTFISRGSITEVTWINIPSAPPVTPVTPMIQFEGGALSDGHGPSSHSCSPGCSSAARPECPSQSARDDLDYFSFGQSESSRRSSDPIAARQFLDRGQLLSHPSSEPHMTSFQPLRKRHCTNDWLVAPTSGGQENQATLYDLGIDAHVVPHPAPHERDMKRAPRYTRIYSTAPSTTKQDRRSVVPKRSSRLPSKVGGSIGVSSKTRQSSQYSHMGSTSTQSASAKIRRGSSQLGHVITSAIAGWRGGAEARGGRRDSRAYLKAILDKLPPLPKPDNVGIYEAMTGAERVNSHRSNDTIPWRKDKAHRRGSCSEDSSSHVCQLAASRESFAAASPILLAHTA